MNPERYEQLMATFLAASQLSPDQREAFLAAACQHDSSLRREVESLLRHHKSRTISTKPHVAAEVDTERSPIRRRITKAQLAARWPRGTQRPLVVAGILVLSLAAVGAWLNLRIKDTVRSHLEEHLDTVLAANVSALREWIAEKQAEVHSWSCKTDLVPEVIELAELHQRQPGLVDALRLSDAYQRLLEELKPVYEREGSFGVVVVSRDGVNLFHNNPVMVGQELTPSNSHYLRMVLQGETILTRPSLERAHLVGFPPTAEAPVMAVAAPVMGNKGRVIAALVFAFDAREEFADLLTSTNLGPSAETFVVDQRGLLLSNLKHVALLETNGLLEKNQVPAMHLELRDPGRDVTAGKRPLAGEPVRPLTAMATAVAAGESGMRLDGYRNLLGQFVVGAWVWLPEYEFAVATEILAAEAYRPLRDVRNAFRLLYVIVGLLTLAILVSSGSLGRVHREMNDVRELGQYSLESLIGQGGMGKVYRARHALLQRPTAVKLFNGEQADVASVRRFEREVQLTSRLEHPNTIQIYDFGRTSDDLFYYAMELLDGVNLAQLVTMEGRLPAARVIYLLTQVCGSLKEAHAAGLIHRDIKPANIMVCRRGGLFDVVKVLDFGLVKDLNREGPGDIEQSQQISGTPRYIAPERLAAPREVDARSDLYSLGAVGYYLLTGVEIFADQSGLQLLIRSVQTAALRPSQIAGVDIPTALDDLIHDCLAAVPDDRPCDVTAVIGILNRLASENSWSQVAAAAAWSKQVPLEIDLATQPE